MIFSSNFIRNEFRYFSKVSKEICYQPCRDQAILAYLLNVFEWRSWGSQTQNRHACLRVSINSFLENWFRHDDVGRWWRDRRSSNVYPNPEQQLCTKGDIYLATRSLEKESSFSSIKGETHNRTARVAQRVTIIEWGLRVSTDYLASRKKVILTESTRSILLESPTGDQFQVDGVLIFARDRRSLLPQYRSRLDRGTLPLLRENPVHVHIDR